MNDQMIDKSLQKFADLMIKQIEKVDSNWEIPWFSVTNQGLPQNIEGRYYHGMNSLLLFSLCDEMKYTTPVFMTFHQAKSQNVHINKGEKSFPVLFWKFSVKDKEGNSIPYDEYKLLSKEDQKQYQVFPFIKVYNVFNIDQTNFAEIHPEKWENIRQKFQPLSLKDENQMLMSPELDKMVKEQKWLCPINSLLINEAYYSIREDKIFIPLKSQFTEGEDFYNTLVHEMAHSTGSSSRLGRELGLPPFLPGYAREELVAEFTAAVTCRSLGITSTIKKENAQYLKNWLQAIRQEPKYLLSILTDVGKASTMILDEVRKLEQKKQQEESLKKENSLPAEEKKESSTEKEEELSPAFKAAIIAAQKGNFRLLSQLKDKGYQPSEKELQILGNSITEKARLTVLSIYQLPTIRDPSLVLPTIEKNNTNTNQTLTLNFQ